jgi:hypothetical protein
VGVSFFDVQTCGKVGPGEAWPVVTQCMRASLPAAAGVAVAALVLSRPLVFGHTLRALSGGAYCMLSLELFGRAVQAYMAPLGLRTPVLMDSPLRAASLREFWGRRWNFVIQELLARYVFRPALSAGWPSWLAVWATFFASGLLHTWPLIMAGLGVADAASVMAYFLSQALAIAVERAAMPSAAPHWARTAFVLAATCAPLPLIVSPTLKLATGQPL